MKSKGNKSKRLDLPNIHNKYSIRKFTVGTASILLGTTLILEPAMMQRQQKTIVRMKRHMLL